MVILLVLLLAVLLLCGLAVVAINEIHKKSSRFTIFDQECPVERVSIRSSGNRPGARHVKAQHVFSENTSEFQRIGLRLGPCLESSVI